MPQFLAGKQREPDLRETIRLTLKRRTHREPSRQMVEDIYQIVIHYAANDRFEKLQRVVEDWAQRTLENEQRRK